MKIDADKTIGTIAGNKAAQAPTATGRAFEEMLSGIEKRAVEQTPASLTIPPVDLISPLALTAVTVSDEALDMLGDYANALADPSLSLKGIALKVHELATMRERLTEARGAIPQGDSLRDLMDEMEGLIGAEIVRFQRGDLLG